MQPIQPLKSIDKVSVGGRKYALRRFDAKGRAEAEVIGIGAPPADDGNDRPLLVPIMVKGKAVAREPLAAARERHADPSMRRRASLAVMKTRFTASSTSMDSQYRPTATDPYHLRT